MLLQIICGPIVLASCPAGTPGSGNVSTLGNNASQPFIYTSTAGQRNIPFALLQAPAYACFAPKHAAMQRVYVSLTAVLSAGGSGCTSQHCSRVMSASSNAFALRGGKRPSTNSA